MCFEIYTNSFCSSLQVMRLFDANGEESSPPLESEEEIFAPIMVDKRHIFDESSLTQVIEGVLNELRWEGIVVTPSEAIAEEAA